MAEPLPADRAVRRPPGLAKRLGRSPALWSAVGKVGAVYMRFVRLTSRFTYEPGHPFDLYGARRPLIFTLWHGQSFLAPFAMERDDHVRALVSKSRDGEATASYLASFGIEAIRGSGGRDRLRSVEKGAIRGFLQLKKSVEEGHSVALIADISNTVARRAGIGVVSLARATGRPIVSLSFAASRAVDVKSWDNATLQLPFGRVACVVGAPIEVAPDADEATLEAKRLEVERSIDGGVARAEVIVGAGRGSRTEASGRGG